MTQLSWTRGAAAIALATLAAVSPGRAQTVIGNWESGAAEGWFDWNFQDNPPANGFIEIMAPRFAFNSIGATLGTGAIQFNATGGAFTQWAAVKLQMGAAPGPPDWNNGVDEWRDDFMTNSKLAFDLTLVASEMSTAPGNDYATINPVLNAHGFGFNALGGDGRPPESITGNEDNFFVDHHFNPSLLVGTRTFTITYDISFTHDGDGIGVDNMEIEANPFYIELLFETYSNGAVVYHLDNVRLFTPTSGGLQGDFDDSNTVDGADLAKWKAGFGMTGQSDDSNGDADADGDVDGDDFLIWQRQVGAAPVVGAVPEPGALALAAGGLAAGAWRRRRRCVTPSL